jgi:hypothetical protein
MHNDDPYKHSNHERKLEEMTKPHGLVEDHDCNPVACKILSEREWERI